MKRKIRVGVVFGGKSTEHEVSLLSAQSIIRALDPERFEVVLIGIDKGGKWALCDNARPLLHADDPKQIALRPSALPMAIVPGDEERHLSVLNDDATRCSHRCGLSGAAWPAGGRRHGAGVAEIGQPAFCRRRSARVGGGHG